MMKRLFVGLIPGVLSLILLTCLGFAPSAHLGFIENVYQQWTQLINWTPVVLILIPTGLSIYFRSARLTWYGIFLFLLYVYLAHDSLGLSFVTGGAPVRHFRHSLLLIPYLIPIQFIVIHNVGRIDFLSLEGLMVFSAFIGEFAGLLLVSGWFAEGLSNLVAVVNGWSIPLTTDVTVPMVLLGLVFGFVPVIGLSRERSYYSHGSWVLFWVVLVTTVPFVKGFEWYLSNGNSLHYVLSLGTAGILLSSWTLNYAWSKAYRDKLTQIRGRLALDERLERLTGLYTIVMIDIDNFKSFNDKYGHDSGDKVLEQVAECLQSGASGDVYRFGGEEFTIIYDGYEIEDVEDELEALRKKISDNKVKVTRKSQRATKVLEKRVTISLGIAEPTSELDTPEKVLNAADESMFKAKDEGRNRLVVSGE